MRAVELEIAARSQSDQVQQAQEAAEKIEDPSIRQEVADRLAKLEEGQHQIEKLVQESGDAEQAATRQLNYRRELWQMRKSLLEREPAAVLLGGLLLLVFAVTLIIAAFSHTDTPEIISSAFLLILGFFFGQTTSRIGSDS